MDLKRMLYFCTIVEQGQVSRAARALHMAQPPLSQRLCELESELGCKLFLRQGRSLQLTEAGQIFYRRAREILQAVADTRDEVVRAALQTGQELRLGLSPTCKSFWTQRYEALRARFPDRRIGLVVGDSSYLEYLLQSGQLDVALMQPPLHPENLSMRLMTTSRTVAVVPVGLFADSVQSLSLTELCAHPLLLLRRSVGVGSYERLLHFIHEAGLQPNVALYSSDVELLLDLLRQGFSGIAVVPETETVKVGASFAVLPIAVDLPDYQLALVYRRADQDEGLINTLLDCWQA